MRHNKLVEKIGAALPAIAMLSATGASFNPGALAHSGGRSASLAGAPLLIGYWHNFNNAARFIRLRDVSSEFDVIDIAFGRPVSGSTSEIGFTVDSHESKSQFTSDVAFQHGRGKKVLLSIGGAKPVIQLNTQQDVQNFVTSVGAIVGEFGFDGIDIDFENNSVVLDAGDVDFKNPTTPAIVNLISALRQLKNAFGPGFIISMAPATFNAQAGFHRYAGGSGSYLPVIFGTRDILSYVHVQDYNTGTRFGLDGKLYTQGTADFHVAMTEMLLQGFPIAGNANKAFPALRQDQVAFGVPASSVDKGFTNNADLINALKYLVQGVSFGGQYQLRNAAGYPGMRGLMTWSINWDVATGFSLSSTVGPFLHSLAPQCPVITKVAASGKNLEVTGSGFDKGAVVVVNGKDQQTAYDVSNGVITALVGIKTIKRARIAPGDTVVVRVRDANGTLSNEMPYTRPA